MDDMKRRFLIAVLFTALLLLAALGALLRVRAV